MQLSPIAVFDSSWSGHHPTYFRAFVRVLLELGYEVLAICPNPQELRASEFAASLGEGLKSRLKLIAFDPPSFRVRPGRWQGAVDSFLLHRWLRRTLREWESKHRREVSFVFFACLYELASIPKNFSWAWSGLYLHCRAFRMPGTPVPYTRIIPRPERLLSHPKMTGIATLDEGAVPFLTQLSAGKPAVSFPDFADNLHPAGGGVGENLRQFAAGRVVVGCLGHLQPTKGVATLARVALAPENLDPVFAFVGSLMRGIFTSEEQCLLDALDAKPNVFTYFEKLPTEADFNAVVEACDILFAAYHDFPHSSNILAKAALFRKPVIVSDGYLMAERVRKFRLGEVVPERDAAVTGIAIRDLTNIKSHWVGAYKPDWKAYSETHSVEALRNAFCRLLTTHDRP